MFYNYLYCFIVLNNYNNYNFKIIDYSSIKRHMEVLLGLARANGYVDIRDLAGISQLLQPTRGPRPLSDPARPVLP